jgi:DNA-binding phage protein
LNFATTVRARAGRDTRFRSALYREAAQALLDGDLPVCKVLLRDLVVATIGFAGAAAAAGHSAASITRMLGAAGNPRAEMLTSLLAAMRDAAGVRVELRVAPLPRAAA